MIRSVRIFSLVALLTFAAAANAATYTVTKADDTNDGVCDADCSLREALAAANADVAHDTIVFDTSVFHTPQTIVLTGGELRIADNTAIAIYGPGASKLTLDGNSTTRILTIGGLANATISGITFTRGNGVSTTSTGRAGAVYNYGGTTLITDCVITGNTAANGGGLNNAASASPSPVSPGNLTIINSVVSNNTASGSGGGMQNFSTSTVTIMNSTFTGNVSNGSTGGGGGAFNGGVRITNSTFSGNSAPAGSGGGMQSNGTLGAVLTNVTFTNNSSLNNGGGIHRGSTNVNFWIRNSIVAGNNGTAASPDVTNSAAGLVSLGNNIIGNVGTSTGWIASDQLGVNPILGPLGSHGGTVRTHPLLSGSPAIDAGQACVFDLSCPTNNPPVAVSTDNRYYSRSASGIDIGAYEVTPSSFAVLPNAGLNAPYSHTIAADATGFLYSVAPGSQLPAGLALSTDGNAVAISGTPTQAGTFAFTLLVVKVPTLEAEGILYTVTVSKDPNDVYFEGRFTFDGGALPEKYYVNLENVDGRSTNLIIPPLGWARVDPIPSDTAWKLTLWSKRLEPVSATIAGYGSIVIPNIEVGPGVLAPTFRFDSAETKKR
ncbi:MAG: right-handed parallel beta-helix repeat-containing protein [Pyrinomonadaceae bacterium]|nr:right-handed parallel beta-helix repeat-containing protein [Pyrinomonadaceae bacterium]